MSIERKQCSNFMDPQVTKRLFTILVLMIGLLCIFGGYMLGRMARHEIKRSSDLLTFNLTTLADNVYKKAKKISPKAVHNHDTEKIRTKLHAIFECTHCNCPALDKYNLAEFIKGSINLQVAKLMRTVYNASQFLDSLR